MPDRLTDLTLHRVALVAEGDDPAAKIVLWKSRAAEYDDLERDVFKRTFTTEQRVALAKKGFAIPVRNESGEIVDGRYPIENEADLLNAARAIGRVAEGDRATVIRHIKKRARALGATDRLGETFKEGAVTEQDLTKAPLTGARRDRLRAAVQEVGAVLDEIEAGRKEERMDDSRKTLPDDLPDEVRSQVEQHIADVEKERDAAVSERDEAKAEVERLSKESAPEPDDDLDPIEKALRDPDVSDVLKAALRTEKDKREAAESEAAEAKAAVAKEREEREREAAIAKAREWTHLPQTKPEDLGPLLVKIEHGTDAETRATIEKVLTSANAIASEALGVIGKGEGAPLESEDRFLARAEEIAKDKGISREQAMAELGRSAEGGRLLRERDAEREEA